MKRRHIARQCAVLSLLVFGLGLTARGQDLRLGASGGWAEQAGSTIPLGHTAGVGLGVSPQATGIAITSDGNILDITNCFNYSISILSKSSSGSVRIHELDLRANRAQLLKRYRASLLGKSDQQAESSVQRVGGTE